MLVAASRMTFCPSSKTAFHVLINLFTRSLLYFEYTGALIFYIDSPYSSCCGAIAMWSVSVWRLRSYCSCEITLRVRKVSKMPFCFRKRCCCCSCLERPCHSSVTVKSRSIIFPSHSIHTGSTIPRMVAKGNWQIDGIYGEIFYQLFTQESENGD